MAPTVTRPPTDLTLLDATAAELMSPNPISIRRDATVREATTLLTDHEFSAAPVIDEAGRPVGVVSRSDILVHDREHGRFLRPVDTYTRAGLTTRDGERLPPDWEVEEVDPTTVEEIMTPGVFAVPADAPLAEVVDQLVKLRVHRLFVTDSTGTLIGVISTLDLLRRLRP
jgi:CBS-domain-containing membrane protein